MLVEKTVLSNKSIANVLHGLGRVWGGEAATVDFRQQFQLLFASVHTVHNWLSDGTSEYDVNTGVDGRINTQTKNWEVVDVEEKLELEHDFGPGVRTDVDPQRVDHERGPQDGESDGQNGQQASDAVVDLGHRRTGRPLKATGHDRVQGDHASQGYQVKEEKEYGAGGADSDVAESHDTLLLVGRNVGASDEPDGVDHGSSCHKSRTHCL